MTMTNPNGGVSCRMTEAKGYAPKRGTPRNKLLISGIYSHTTEWGNKESYNKDNISAAHGVPPPKFNQWNPVGMLRQAPACRVEYKGTGPAGGRKCPRGYIGAAHRHMKHGDSVKVYFDISDDAITLAPRSGA